MRAAIADLAKAQGMKPDSGIAGRKIAVIGDMLELGEDTERQHIALAEPLVACSVDLVVTVGQASDVLQQTISEPMRGGHAANAEGASQILLDIAQPGDVITVKGSNAIGLSSVVDALQMLDQDMPVRRAVNG